MGFRNVCVKEKRGCNVLGDVEKMCPAYVRLGRTSRDGLAVKGGNAVCHGCHSESCACSLIDDDDYMTTPQCVSKLAPLPLLPLVAQFAFPLSLTSFSCGCRVSSFNSPINVKVSPSDPS